MSEYQTTIGIECHVQLKTKTKLFSGADNDARDKAANTTVSPICFGLPGTLPVLNRGVIDLSIKAGLALKSTLAPISRFERKHYFYPDLPKGYQITQLAEPIIGAGEVEISLPSGTTHTVRIHHAHLEEDAGKLTHPAGQNYSLVDLNRAGTPLIEIVSEPDMHSPEEAKAFATELYMLMTYAGVTNGDLYYGNMRFDVNVSVAKVGEPLGTRTETKNLNSFRSVEKAAEFEVQRQIAVLESGEPVIQETRGWNEAKQQTFAQRSKADAHDYRYFPDADLPPIRITREQIDAVKQSMPKLPHEYRQTFAKLGVDSSVVISLLSKQPLADLVVSVLEKSDVDTARKVANWCASELTEITFDNIHGAVDEFIALATMTKEGEISSNTAKELFNRLIREAYKVRDYASDNGLLQLNDDAAIQAAVKAVLADPASQKAIDDIKAGNDRAIGYLVGQAMKQSAGKANPAMLQNLIRTELDLS